MTHEEIASQLHGARKAKDWVEVDRIIHQLNPPRPEPGTVVWFPFDKSYGIVSPDGRGVYNQNGELLAWWEVEMGTTPARILAPDEIPVKIPPVSEWDQRSTAAQIILQFWDGDRRDNTINVRTITRTEALCMENK